MNQGRTEVMTEIITHKSTEEVVPQKELALIYARKKHCTHAQNQVKMSEIDTVTIAPVLRKLYFLQH